MRYFLGFLITIGLIIVLIFMIFGGNGGSKSKVPTSMKTLDSYATTDAQVRLTIDAPVNAEQEHKQLRITVDRDQVTYEQIGGYNGVVTTQQHFTSNKNAYQAFLLSLSNAGFTKGDTDKALADERGHCPLGDRYIFELTQDSHTIERFWSSSCGKPKTYLGMTDLTIRLFEAQVPNFNDLTNNIPL